VEGVAAIGVGTTMLLHCDLAYAGASAKFGLPFANLGLTPEAASSWLLPMRAGYARAAELLMLGEVFSAQTAMDLGIVNGVLPDGQVLEHAL
jgi:enoyl-CoA hydratase/carnithine racemase